MLAAQRPGRRRGARRRRRARPVRRPGQRARLLPPGATRDPRRLRLRPARLGGRARWRCWPSTARTPRVLAGGHSLLPVMKLRLAAPELIIDIGRLPELSLHRRSTATRWRSAPAPGTGRWSRPTCWRPRRRCWPRSPARSATRRSATAARIGGSLAHADPASDLPAAVLALGGTVVLRGPRGERSVPITEFYTGVFSTVKEPDELIIEIRVPRTGGGRLGLREVHPPGQRLGDRRGRRGRRPGRAGQHGRRRRCGRPPPRPRWPAARRSRTPPRWPPRAPTRPADLTATREYRRHLARVLTRRALTTARG